MKKVSKIKKNLQWRDRLTEKRKERLLKCLQNEGAIVNPKTGQIYFDLRDCPYDLVSDPELFRECTAADLIKENKRG